MARKAARQGDLCTGHGSYSSRPSISGSQNTFIDGSSAHRVGDVWVPHCGTSGCHNGVTVTGSGKVFINNRQASGVGDAVDCGSRIMTGSNKVFIGK